MILKPIRRVVAGLILLTLALAAYSTVRIALADCFFRQGSEQSIRRATYMAPGNPEYLKGLARVDRAAAFDALRSAVSLSPDDAGLRVDLALAFETRGDFRDAEESLARAIQLDRTFAPRLALADFYFRRHEPEKFWPIAKSALAVSYGDNSILFRECWAFSSDGNTILANAIPARSEIHLQYLNFLLAEGRLDAAAQVAPSVLAGANQDRVACLLQYCNRQLEAGRGEDAAAVWNGLIDRKLIPHRADGDFRLPAIGGFDWRIFEPAGVYVDPDGPLALTFTGKEAESAELLSRYVMLLPHRKYLLAVEYDSTGIPAESGLQFLLPPLRLAADLPGGQDGEKAWQFQFTAGDASLARLILIYRRPLGTVRLHGSVAIQKIALGLASEDLP